MLLTEVDHYIKRYNLIQPNSKVMIGVSGGPDSMALLHYFLVKRKKQHLDIIAVSIEHGLRGKAAEEDIDYVRLFCEKNNIRFEVERINVSQYKKEAKLGTQEAARILRYEAFDQLMKQYQADYLALAHHGDDQVETVYMRLTRGTQLDSLQGMKNKRPFSTGHIIRPFLSLTKEMIEQYCQENDLTPRRDLSNDEDIYTRNYFRLHVLPLLKRKNPSLSDTMMYMTENIAKDIQYLSDQTKKVSQEVLHFSDNPKKATCQINELKAQPPALQRRLFHLILDYLYVNVPTGLNYRHERQFFDLIANDRANASVDLPQQLKMIKSYQSLIFQFEQDEQPAYYYPLVIPGRMTLPNQTVLVTEIVNRIEPSSSRDSTIYLPVNIDRLPALYIRTRQPGDRIYLAQIDGRKKVKSIFIDEKIPLFQRDQWPILVQENDEILWVIGLAKSDFAKAEKEHYIKITYYI